MEDFTEKYLSFEKLFIIACFLAVIVSVLMTPSNTSLVTGNTKGTSIKHYIQCWSSFLGEQEFNDQVLNYYWEDNGVLEIQTMSGEWFKTNLPCFIRTYRSGDTP